MAETTATVTSSWRAKTSVKSRSNLSAQMCAPVIVSINCPEMRTFPAALRTDKDITDAKHASDLLDIDGFAFERKARIASDDEQRFEPQKRGDNFLNHSVREVFLLVIAAHVLERQHGDRRL